MLKEGESKDFQILLGDHTLTTSTWKGDGGLEICNAFADSS